MRPVDKTTIDRRTFGARRHEALEASVCIRCKQTVDVERLPLVDASEYRISAMCPRCWDAIFEGMDS